MEILKTGTMPDGTHVQLEEWKDDYDFMPYGNVVASYPKSKMSHEGRYSPKANENYRFDFVFDSNKKAESVFNDLVNGNKNLSDHKNYLYNKKYANCI